MSGVRCRIAFCALLLVLCALPAEAAFPTISDADTKSGTVTSNSTSWTITYPTNVAAGDLLLLFFAIDGVQFATLPVGWVGVAGDGGGSAITLEVDAKVAVGTETGTFTATISGSEQGAWRCFRIPAASWFGGTISGPNSNGFSVAIGPGTSSTPDPPNLDPANWATEDTLWIVACALDTSRTISAYPLVSRNTADVSGGSTGATLGMCTTTSTVGSLDPGTFTASASDDWGAATVAVRPAGGAPAATPKNMTLMGIGL